jgi:glycosyltransferase involved in cell wall biosynthesis
MKEGYIKKNKRKNILLLTDDIRTKSGVAQVGRETVLHTCHKYNWVQLAGAMEHPELGQISDISDEYAKESEVSDASVKVYPVNGYGSPDILRGVIQRENIDAIFLITDPRYFTWLFQMEAEVRKHVPIIYLNIWDDYPAPAYNQEYYESCDALFGISKQSKHINEVVLGDKGKNKIFRYIPHGLSDKYFKKIDKDDVELQDFKKHLYNGEEPEFSLLFNSRNIRRKQIPNTILAWKLFCKEIGREKAEKCKLVLHTDTRDPNGTDILAILDYLSEWEDTPDNIIIDENKYPTVHMGYLYNCVDGIIQLSNAEGWGLTLTEALLTGTPIIANVTGGMQDQMRFIDENGNWYTNNNEVPSNHRGTYKEHGSWAFPVFSRLQTMVGSVPTPYIFEDQIAYEDAAEQIMNLYKLSAEEREKRGLEGQKWALSDEAGFTSRQMGERIIEGIDELFATWEPREQFEFLADTDYEKRVLKHKLLY